MGLCAVRPGGRRPAPVHAALIPARRTGQGAALPVLRVLRSLRMGGDASGRDGKWYWSGKVMPLRSGPPPIRWPERERRPGRTAASHVRKKRPEQGTGLASQMNSIGAKARNPGLCAPFTAGRNSSHPTLSGRAGRCKAWQFRSPGPMSVHSRGSNAPDLPGRLRPRSLCARCRNSP